MEKLKESFVSYANNFGRILALALPAILIGLVCAGYPEKAVGLDTGAIKIPSSPVTLALMAFSAVIFLVTIFWNQFALSELIANRGAGFFECYKRGWRRLGTSWEKIKSLPKIFGAKRLIIIFVVWLAFNGGTAFVSQQILELNFWVEKGVFNILNFLILFPFFHIYGFSLFKNSQNI
ncbi:MAG: hypothetical protein PHE52_00715 [Candidatus Pacebacteria bacterium]|nr:hypothetical protein [Candidatus Paceibacterota bacterium]